MSRDAGKRPAGSAVWLFLGSCLLFAQTGCQSSSSCYLEAELRCREREIREMRAEMDRLACYNQALQQHAAAAPGSSAKFPAEAGAPISDLVLGRQTGGFDDDRKPGDEALQVVIEPHDPNGRPYKAPGSVFIAVLQPGPDGQEVPLCSWDIPPEALRRTWRYTLISTGYHLILPWKVLPEKERLRVLVQFQLPDGYILEADREITVRLVPADERTTESKKPPAPGADPVGLPRKEAPKTQAPTRRPPSVPRLVERQRPQPAAAPAEVQRATLWQENPDQKYISDFVQLGSPEPLQHPLLRR